MNIVVLTPDEEVFTGEIKSVKLPGTSGSFEILKGHAALVSSLKEGIVSIRTENENVEFKIEKGFVEVLNDEINILVQGYSLINN